MPTGTTPISEGESVGPLSVTHTNGVAFTITPGTGYPEGDGEEAVQDLINHLTAWPERDTTYPVESTKTEAQTYAITADPAE